MIYLTSKCTVPIDFVPDYQLTGLGASVSIDLGDPVADMLKRLLIRHVVHLNERYAEEKR